MNKRQTRISKYLNFILRHEPESIGVKLEDDRWLGIDLLLSKATASGKSITDAQVRELVALPEDTHFEISSDGTKIRAI